MRVFTAIAAVGSLSLFSITASHAETFRLIHSIGTDENVVAKGLTKEECDGRKQELKVVAEALGTYNERTGHGSIVCLSDSFFEN